MRSAVLLLLALFLSHCKPDEPQAPDTLTYHEHAKPILDANCTGCHIAGGIGPMPLTSFDEVFAYREIIREKVASRVMPPWLAAPGHRRYLDDASLTEAEIATLVSWVRSGGKEGSPNGAATAVPFRSGLTRVDYNITMEAPYTPANSPDDYRCFVLATPNVDTVYVTGFDAKPGNAEMVHHIIAYLTYPEAASYTTALDAAAEGDGYPCFGGPGAIGANDYDYTSVGGWGPGNSAVEYPKGTGIRVPPGSKIILQIHYNTHGEAHEPDQTSIELQTADSVDKEGFFISWLNPYWLLPNVMTIRGDDPEVQFDFAFDPTLLTLDHTPIVAGRPFLIHAAALHMHLLGKSGSLYIKASGQPEKVLLEIPRWDFHWQRQFYFEEPVRFNPGEQLGIRCVWDNSAENQPWIGGRQKAPQDRSWGEGSEDEMCVGFFYTTAE